MVSFDEYEKLPAHVKAQLTTISKTYKNKVDLNRSPDKKMQGQDLINWAVVSNNTIKSLLENHYDVLECYSDDGDRIVMGEVLKSGRHAVVVSGVYGEREVIVKYYERDERKIDVTYEIGIYRKLAELDCKIPWFSDKFMMLGKRVLVVEKLLPLGKDDNIYKIGMSVVEQLSYLHTFAIHNDIKPDNIMKKIVDGKPEYYLIDYGGVTLEKLCCGFRRKIWSPKWTCQPRGGHNQVTYPKHDFIELVLTLNYIHRGCSYRNYKKICEKCLGGFNSHAVGLGKKMRDQIDYDEIIEILRAKNT